MIGPPSSPLPQDVTDADLATFSIGIADPDLEDRLLEALVCSWDLRERLRAVSSEVRRLGARPWRAGDPERSGLVGSLLTNRLRGSIDLIAGLRSNCLERGWSSLRREVEGEAVILRAAVAAVGAAIGLSLRAGPMATARGLSEEPIFEGALPSGVSMSFSAEIVSDGALEAQATFADRSSGHASAMEGRRIQLELLDPAGGSLPIGGANVKAGEWKTRAEDFGDLTGMPPGLLPSRLFRLRAGMAPISSVARNHLFVELESPDELPVVFDLYDDVKIADGQLMVAIGVPFEVRRKFGQYELQLFLPLGRIYQMIGSWAIGEWGDEPRVLAIELPAGKDRVLETGSILRGRLIRQTGAE
jgi:hypothetical protein